MVRFPPLDISLDSRFTMNLFTSLLLTVSIALCSSVNAGLVGHWAGNDNALDSVAANDGLWTGNTTYVPGRIGSAFQFDGLSYVSIPSVPAYQFGTGDFSVSLWVKFDALQGNFDGFLHKDNYGIGGAPTGWLFNVANGLGGVGMEVRNGPGGQVANARESSTSFILNTWYNFIGVRQGNSVALYIDGQLAATATSASPINVNNNVNLDIGALGIGDRQYFNGAVDEVQLYNHALSGSEIEAIADVPEVSTWAAVIMLLGLIGLQRGHPLRRRVFRRARAVECVQPTACDCDSNRAPDSTLLIPNH